MNDSQMITIESQKIHIIQSLLYKIIKICKTKLNCLQMHIKILIKRQGND